MLTKPDAYLFFLLLPPLLHVIPRPHLLVVAPPLLLPHLLIVAPPLLLPHLLIVAPPLLLPHLLPFVRNLLLRVLSEITSIRSNANALSAMKEMRIVVHVQ